MNNRDKNGKFATTANQKYHKGYKVVYMPSHQRARSNGYVYEHILVMERKIGRPLTKEEVVHHVDGNKQNNDPNNLELFSNNTEHVKEHWREREDKRYMVNGNMVSIAEMSALSNQPYMRVYQRIKRLGWTPERAMQ